MQKVALLLLSLCLPLRIVADSHLSSFATTTSVGNMAGRRGNRVPLKNKDSPAQGTTNAILTAARGGAVASKAKPIVASKAKPVAEGVGWFKPGAPVRTKWLGFWLLLWNSVALVDALMFTFRAKQNLDGYLIGDWGQHTLAMTRMLANCQLGLISTITLVAWVGDEKTIKNMFKILILVTLGAFRAVFAGVADGTIKAPWKTGYAAAMTLPPLLLLSYFAFVF